MQNEIFRLRYASLNMTSKCKMQNAKCDSSKMQNDKNKRQVILPAVNYLLNFITAFVKILVNSVGN